MKEQVIVTGGLGFIGFHLVKELSKKYHVGIVDNLSTNKVNDKQEILKYGELLIGDVRDYKFLVKTFRNTRYVFHLAAVSTIPAAEENPLLAVKVNIGGTDCVLRAAETVGVEKVIFTSSSSIYERKSLYAETKFIGESLCRGWKGAVMLRLFNVYGPGQGNNVVKCFMDKVKKNESIEIYGDGSIVRDYVYIDDVVKAFIYFAEYPEKVYEAIDIGTGRGINLLELADLIDTNIDKTIDMKERREGDADKAIANIEIAKDYGFEAKISLEEGIKRLWEER